VLEVVWLHFKPGSISKASPTQDSKGLRDFLELGAEFESSTECEEVSWGRDEENHDTLVMFICWKRHESSMDSPQAFSAGATTERCASRFPDLASPPQLQRFPCKDKLSRFDVLVAPFKLLELVSFYVPVGPSSKELFKRAFNKYRSTMILPSILNTQSYACTSLPLGGWEVDNQIFYRDNKEMLRFTGIFSWNGKQGGVLGKWNHAKKCPEMICTNQEARAQWYKDFAEGMNWYERLGNIIDALKLQTVTDGVKSRFVTDIKPVSVRRVRQLSEFKPDNSTPSRED